MSRLRAALRQHGGDPEQEYFSDGITEDIITDLGKVSALSSWHEHGVSFKGAKGGVGEIGRQTKAAYVLAGSVRKAGTRVRITAQLEAPTSAGLGRALRPRPQRIFALQDEISRAIVAALKLTLLPEEKRALEQRATTNVKAYKFYLMARQFSVMGNERHQEISSGCASARWSSIRPTPRPGRQWRSRSGTCTGAAPATKTDRKRQTRRCGRSATGRCVRGARCGAPGPGSLRSRLKACESALQLDPGSYEGNRIAGMCSMALRRYDDAIRYFEAAAAVVDTEFTAASFAPQCYEAKGDTAGGGRRIEACADPYRGRDCGRAGPRPGAGLRGGLACLALGEADRAKEWIERGTLLDPDNTILHFNFVCALTRLREFEAAIDLLSSVIEKGSQGWLTWLDNDTDFDPLRSHPRFIELVANAKARFAMS